jgi:isopenicillin-N N-acyltransferase-like protein
MFPELTKAQCSFFGAWGTASKAGHSYQLRALDFDTTGPFKDFPQVTIYHPNEGHAWGQVGWPGDIGVLTGFSDQQLAISEIGVSYPDDSFGQGTDNTPPEKVHGEPWMFILRDVLQYEDSLTGAQNRITNANRTCNLIIGVGDGDMGKANGVQFSGYVANFYEDYNILPANETWHAPIENVVYNGMDWLCANYNSVLGDQLRKFHGSIDETVTMQNILPTVQTGSLHIAVYDLTEQNMHVSFSRSAAADPSEPFHAYERQYTRLRMKDMFAQQPPADK